jgi:hypothetical protein
MESTQPTGSGKRKGLITIFTLRTNEEILVQPGINKKPTRAINFHATKIQKVTTFKRFVASVLRFHRWPCRDEIFETRSHLYIFRQNFFIKQL